MKKRRFADGGSVPDMNTAIDFLRQGDKAGAEDVLRQIVGLPTVSGTEAGLREIVGLPANPTQQLHNTVGLGASAAPTANNKAQMQARMQQILEQNRAAAANKPRVPVVKPGSAPIQPQTNTDRVNQFLKVGDTWGAENEMRKSVGLPPAPPVPQAPAGGRQLSDATNYLKSGGSQGGANLMLRDVVGANQPKAQSTAVQNLIANRQQVLANRAKAPVKFAKGGSVSSRGDGCAQRGKTKGRMV